MLCHYAYDHYRSVLKAIVQSLAKENVQWSIRGKGGLLATNELRIRYFSFLHNSMKYIPRYLTLCSIAIQAENEDSIAEHSSLSS